MSLYLLQLRLIILRYRVNYLYVILSMIVSFVAIAVATIYCESMLILSTNSPFYNLNRIYSSIRVVIIIAGITFIMNQYYIIMKASTRDYHILRVLGATRNNIRILILEQVFLLIFITLPLGLFIGYFLTGSIMSFFDRIILNHNKLEIIDSVKTFILVSGCICFSIILIGFYLERGVLKTPISSILTEVSVFEGED